MISRLWESDRLRIDVLFDSFLSMVPGVRGKYIGGPKVPRLEDFYIYLSLAQSHFSPLNLELSNMYMIHSP